jgi:hypothetical protein
MRGKKTRQQITIEICINHATADERLTKAERVAP